MKLASPYTREIPYFGEILSRGTLAKSGSCKPAFTLRVTLDPQMHYLPGDSIAIIPKNNPEHIDRMTKLLGSSSGLQGRSLLHVTSKFIRFALPYARDPKPLQELLDGGRITDFVLPAWEVLELCCNVPVEECTAHLPPILPRYYSIASADNPGSVDLLIGHTEVTTWRGEVLPGLCTDYLSRIDLNDPSVALYLHSAEHFRLPEDLTQDIIMIGPGTGVAPFRAFLHVRKEMPGRNWLFFGAQHKAYDFYYEKELEALVEKKALKLELAFSRDQEEKIYVQDLLLERGDEMWEWLEGGAHLYICGDAKKMAKGVEEALKKLAEKKGHDGAIYLKRLRREKRLSLDVY